ncbi:acyl-CoA thioesterase [Halopseudomonas xiamenensis]|uniref:acyl-CoA thioesterase n=1 Tax=Halopseudomonas xiamenensis TaxID=157792 RepID=UPI0016295191|nr:thioesterase family protein [Halopseudomonas xiamenensis]
MKWDLQNPFIDHVLVQPEDIDELGHANNAVYVRWLERCAWQHSQSLGLGLPEYQQLNRAMVVVRHEIDYLAAAYVDEQLQMATWIVSWDSKLRMTRRFQLIRPDDGVTLLRAHTTFACVELSSGRPRRMPAEFVEGYGQAIVA